MTCSSAKELKLLPNPVFNTTRMNIMLQTWEGPLENSPSARSEPSQDFTDYSQWRRLFRIPRQFVSGLTTWQG